MRAGHRLAAFALPILFGLALLACLSRFGGGAPAPIWLPVGIAAVAAAALPLKPRMLALAVMALIEYAIALRIGRVDAGLLSLTHLAEAVLAGRFVARVLHWPAARPNPARDLRRGPLAWLGAALIATLLPPAVAAATLPATMSAWSEAWASALRDALAILCLSPGLTWLTQWQEQWPQWLRWRRHSHGSGRPWPRRLRHRIALATLAAWILALTLLALDPAALGDLPPFAVLLPLLGMLAFVGGASAVLAALVWLALAPPPDASLLLTLAACALPLAAAAETQRQILARLRRERDAARAALARTEAVLSEHLAVRKALDAQVSIATTDTRGTILEASDMFCQLTGYPREELIGRPISILRSGQHDAAFYGELWNTLNAGQVWRGDICNRGREGKLYWVSATMIPMPGPDGKPARYLSVRADISERKRAEAALADQSSLLQALLAAVPDGLFIMDLDRRITLVNAAWLAQHGIASADAVIGKRVSDLFDADIAAQIDAEDIAVLRDGAPLNNIGRELKADGGVRRWYAISKSRLSDARGETIGMIGIMRDITEIKRALDELDSERNLLQAVINTVPDDIFAMDADGRYTLMNKTGRYLRGIADEREIIGQPVHAVSAGLPANAGGAERIDEGGAQVRDTSGDEAAQDRQLMQVGKPLFNLERSVAYNGFLERWVSTSKLPLRAAGGQIYGLLVINRDVTDVRQAMAQVGLLNAELEARIQSRTAELENTLRELDTFAYSVAHDLRNPLRRINGLAHLVGAGSESRLNDRERQALRRIQSAMDSMDALTEGMLAFSHILKHKMRIANVDLSAMARRIVTELRKRDPERVVEVDIADALHVRGDAELIRVALGHLLGNAWKFTAKTADAAIRVTPYPGGAGRAFRVSDNGVGFDSRYAERLFQGFQRLHAEHEFPGAGVGLAMVGSIVRRHGGRIQAEAGPQAGASFIVDLG